jgi:hypothetical protein
MRRAVSVTRCSGCSIRPASSQPNPTAPAPTTSRAIPPWVSSVFRAFCRVSAAIRWYSAWPVLGGLPAPVASVGLVAGLTLESERWMSAMFRSPDTPGNCWDISAYVTPSSSTPASRNSTP